MWWHSSQGLWCFPWQRCQCTIITGKSLCCWRAIRSLDCRSRQSSHRNNHCIHFLKHCIPTSIPPISHYNNQFIIPMIGQRTSSLLTRLQQMPRIDRTSVFKKKSWLHRQGNTMHNLSRKKRKRNLCMRISSQNCLNMMTSIIKSRLSILSIQSEHRQWLWHHKMNTIRSHLMIVSPSHPDKHHSNNDRSSPLNSQKKTRPLHGIQKLHYLKSSNKIKQPHTRNRSTTPSQTIFSPPFIRVFLPVLDQVVNMLL